MKEGEDNGGGERRGREEGGRGENGGDHSLMLEQIHDGSDLG